MAGTGDERIQNSNYPSSIRISGVAKATQGILYAASSSAMKLCPEPLCEKLEGHEGEHYCRTVKQHKGPPTGTGLQTLTEFWWKNETH